MKKLFISTIRFYKSFISPVLKQVLGIQKICRYDVSCSTYAMDVIKKKGVVKGLALSFKRIITCANPNYSYGKYI